MAAGGGGGGGGGGCPCTGISRNFLFYDVIATGLYYCMSYRFYRRSGTTALMW